MKLIADVPTASSAARDSYAEPLALFERSRMLDRMPVVILFLGVISLSLIVWTNETGKRLRMDYAVTDALESIQIRTATAHLWLEQIVAGDKRLRIEGVWSDMDEAQRLADAILKGGASEHGITLKALKDQALRAKVEEIGALIKSFRDMAGERYRRPADSALDERTDAVFKELQDKALALEMFFEKREIRNQARSGALFLWILALWSLIIVAAFIGLSRLQRSRRAAEDALMKAHREMEQRVEERTAEKLAIEEEARRAGHLASLGELAAGVAHEINNPVNGIINYAQIASNKSRPGSKEHEIACMIMKEGDRIAGILKSLLSFAREDKRAKEPVSVGHILAECLSLVDSLMRKEGIILQLDVPSSLPRIAAHPQQLEQVFLNVINNARYALKLKYSGPHDNKILRITAEQGTMGGERPCIRMTFHDHGTGIPAEIIGKVMNPFFSTKPKGKGTGLGLSISQGIIIDHGGRIEITSADGEFTEVVIELPVIEKSNAKNSDSR